MQNRLAISTVRMSPVVAWITALSHCGGLTAAPSAQELLSPWLGVLGAFPTHVEVGEKVLVWGIGLDNLQITSEGGTIKDWTSADVIDRVYDVERWAIRSFIVPDQAGRYMLSVPGAGASVEVVVEPPRPAGPEVVLPPGLHRWSGPRQLTAGTTLIAYGAVIDGQGGPLFKLAPNCRILGGTYQNFSVFAESGNGSGLQIIDAHIRGGRSGAGWSQERMVIRDCVLERWFLHVENTQGALIHRNRFVGLTLEGHAFRCVRAKHLVMIDNIFDGTDRGIVFQPQRGPVENCLFYRNTFRNIDHVHGGNEVFLVEMGPHAFSWNMNFHQRVYGCGSAAVMLWGCPASDNLWYDLKSVDAGGILLTDVPSHPEGEKYEQVRNLFIRCELNGGRVRFGNKARHNVIAETGVICPIPGRGSVQRHRPHYYKAGVIFDAGVVGNRVINCSVYDRNGFVVGRNVVLEGIMIEPNDPRRE